MSPLNVIESWVRTPSHIYHPKLLSPFVFTLKPMKLSQGKHQLKIVCQGKDPASANTLIGVDYVTWKTLEK